MSFGFSPSDVVLFGTFIDKVVAALKSDEGGSQYDYRIVQQQCQGFLDIMEEIQRLDFSNIPESYQDKVRGYAATVTEIVSDFRSAIVRYEKSMGKETKRGVFQSAPRKVQWALRAADDVNKLRQRLATQVDLIKLMFTMSLIEIMGNTSQPDPRLIASGSFQAGSSNVPGIVSVSRPMSHIAFVDIVEGVADLIYDRLLSRPQMPIANYGRFYTLPSDTSTHTHSGQLNPTRESHAIQSIMENDHQVGDGDLTSMNRPSNAVEAGDQDAFTNGLNEYLRSLNVDELSEHERAYLGRLLGAGLKDGRVKAKEEAKNGENFHYDPLDRIPRLLEEPANTCGDATSGECDTRERRPGQSTTHHHTRQKSRYRPSLPSFRLDALSMTASVISIVSLAIQISSQLSKRYSEVEYLALSRRIHEYSQLLRIMADVMPYDLAGRNMRDLANEVILQSKATMAEVNVLLDGSRGARLARILQVLRGEPSGRKRATYLMEEIESLKATVSCMLQMHLIRLAEYGYGAKVTAERV